MNGLKIVSLNLEMHDYFSGRTMGFLNYIKQLISENKCDILLLAGCSAFRHNGKVVTLEKFVSVMSAECNFKSIWLPDLERPTDQIMFFNNSVTVYRCERFEEPILEVSIMINVDRRRFRLVQVESPFEALENFTARTIERYRGDTLIVGNFALEDRGNGLERNFFNHTKNTGITLIKNHSGTSTAKVFSRFSWREEPIISIEDIVYGGVRIPDFFAIHITI
jgi:hypothetical protein